MMHPLSASGTRALQVTALLCVPLIPVIVVYRCARWCVVKVVGR